MRVKPKLNKWSSRIASLWKKDAAIHTSVANFEKTHFPLTLGVWRQLLGHVPYCRAFQLFQQVPVFKWNRGWLQDAQKECFRIHRTPFFIPEERPNTMFVLFGSVPIIRLNVHRWIDMYAKLDTKYWNSLVSDQTLWNSERVFLDTDADCCIYKCYTSIRLGSKLVGRIATIGSRTVRSETRA